MADSASAPEPAAPATAGERRRPTAAPGPIELSDEKTVQTLATPDSFGAPLARLSPSPTGHGYGSTPPSTSTARRGAKPCIFPAPDSGTSTALAPHAAASSERHEGRRPSSSPCEPLATPRDAEPPAQRHIHKTRRQFPAVPRPATRSVASAALGEPVVDGVESDKS